MRLANPIKRDAWNVLLSQGLYNNVKQIMTDEVNSLPCCTESRL